MDRCFEEAATEWAMEWDKQNEWKDARHLGGQEETPKIQDEGDVEHGQRLTKLPPREKAKIVVAQIPPTPLYGAELHDTPWEAGERLLRKMNRWITGAYRGSSADRLTRLTGLEGL